MCVFIHIRKSQDGYKAFRDTIYIRALNFAKPGHIIL